MDIQRIKQFFPFPGHSDSLAIHSNIISILLNQISKPSTSFQFLSSIHLSFWMLLHLNMIPHEFLKVKTTPNQCKKKKKLF